MTLRELSQLYWLKKEIEIDRERLKKLRAKTGLSSIKLSGLPPSGAKESTVELISVKIIDLEKSIEEKIQRCVLERERLEQYISSIDDSLTRTIFTLRFVNCLSWNKISARLGGANTWKNLSNICYRYIEKENSSSQNKI